MRMFSLSGRLMAAADFVAPGARVADVGTDHGKLPVWLMLQGRISAAIASDIREQPLCNARETVAKNGLSGRIQLRLCDGLAGITAHEVDTVVIAGMGGDTIAAILAAAPWTKDGAHRLILQPETASVRLRRFLYDNGYTILDETLVQEHRLYSILLVTGGTDAHGSDPLYARVSAPMLRRGGALAVRYVQQARHRLQLEQKGMTPQDAAQADILIARMNAWEGAANADGKTDF